MNHIQLKNYSYKKEKAIADSIAYYGDRYDPRFNNSPTTHRVQKFYIEPMMNDLAEMRKKDKELTKKLVTRAKERGYNPWKYRIANINRGMKLNRIISNGLPFSEEPDDVIGEISINKEKMPVTRRSARNMELENPTLNVKNGRIENFDRGNMRMNFSELKQLSNILKSKTYSFSQLKRISEQYGNYNFGWFKDKFIPGAKRAVGGALLATAIGGAVAGGGAAIGINNHKNNVIDQAIRNAPDHIKEYVLNEDGEYKSNFKSPTSALKEIRKQEGVKHTPSYTFVDSAKDMKTKMSGKEGDLILNGVKFHLDNNKDNGEPKKESPKETKPQPEETKSKGSDINWDKLNEYTEGYYPEGESEEPSVKNALGNFFKQGKASAASAINEASDRMGANTKLSKAKSNNKEAQKALDAANTDYDTLMKQMYTDKKNKNTADIRNEVYGN